MAGDVRAPELADWLLAHGRTSATTREVAELLGVPEDQVRVRLLPLIRTGKIFTPSRGLWIPIPTGFRTWKVTPGLHFIDDLMKHLGRSYYVGWLSAAEIWGAAHQRPQVFQVAVDRPVANRRIERVRLEFATRARAAKLPAISKLTETGYARVATPELISFDLVDQPRWAAGLSNTATVLAELSEEAGLNGVTLAELSLQFPEWAARRLGYLLEFVEAEVDLEPLRSHLSDSWSAAPAPLHPRLPRRGPLDRRWNLLINTEVEPDL